tara:strand:+ start:2164 stop:2436 length:273 start_codon:yes stop_codon:yes gene_type:complete
MDRIRIVVNLGFATFTALVDLCFPELIPGTTQFIVKRVSAIINNGFEGSSRICEEVSASTGESRIMDETSSSDLKRYDDIEEEHSSCDEL